MLAVTRKCIQKLTMVLVKSLNSNYLYGQVTNEGQTAFQMLLYSGQ